MNEVGKLRAENLIDLSKVSSLPYMSEEDRISYLNSLEVKLCGKEGALIRQIQKEEQYRANRAALKRNLPTQFKKDK